MWNKSLHYSSPYKESFIYSYSRTLYINKLLSRWNLTMCISHLFRELLGRWHFSKSKTSWFVPYALLLPALFQSFFVQICLLSLCLFKCLPSVSTEFIELKWKTCLIQYSNPQPISANKQFWCLRIRRMMVVPIVNIGEKKRGEWGEWRQSRWGGNAVTLEHRSKLEGTARGEVRRKWNSC